MRWSLIRLICLRDLRDQLRDRRTVLMMAVIPFVLYPLVGFGLIQFAMGYAKKSSIVGIQGVENLPSMKPLSLDSNPLPMAPWLAINPQGGAAAVASSSGRAFLIQQGFGQDAPPLLIKEGETLRFAGTGNRQDDDSASLTVRLIDGPASGKSGAAQPNPDDRTETAGRTALNEKQVDVLIVVPDHFQQDVDGGGRGTLLVLTRHGDEYSRIVGQRVHALLRAWKNRLKEVRFVRANLPAHFDDPVQIVDPEAAKSSAKQAADGLFEMLVRIIPFMIVMWSLAGALYPAVDLCAGEKERGTMETLLISPAGREEIVVGKFLTIWFFSAVTALLNLLSLGATTWQFRGMLPGEALRPGPLLWCVVLVLPLSAFFSAISLAVGAYARSSKEGQYYLMPLFLVTMPFVFLSLAPGVELNPFYCMVPVTGVALLMQRFMITTSPDEIAYFYLVPVLAPMALYGWLALRWAIEQFQREEVLFREAERLDLGLWIKNLFRDKEAFPSTGQALFCFALIIVLRFFSFGWGEQQSLLQQTLVGFLGFLLPAPLFMALILTAKPRKTLALSMPSLPMVLAAVLLAILVLAPRVELKALVLDHYPGFIEQRKENHPLTEGLHAWIEEGRLRAPVWLVFLAVALMPALTEELAFRGFIQSGLRRRFSPWKAIALSSFLYAIYQMNVFKFAPAFALGLIMGWLTERSRSVLPAMLFHFVHNSLRIGLVLIGYTPWLTPIGWGITVACAIAALAILYRLTRVLDEGKSEPVPAPFRRGNTTEFEQRSASKAAGLLRD
jgi:sodium transport system permease protein